MTTCDIFFMVSKILNKNTKEDVNGLYNLSQTCKEMNSIINLNTDYNVLKKLATFCSPSEAVCKTIYKVIDSIYDTREIEIKNIVKIALDNVAYIIPYLSNDDISNINVELCSLYLDWNDTIIPGKYSDRILIEGKILHDFIRTTDNHYEFHLLLPFQNNQSFAQYEEGFLNWLRMLDTLQDLE